MPMVVVPVAIHTLLGRYLGPGYPRSRRAFLREWRFAVATLGRVRLVVVGLLLLLTFYSALLIPLSFRRSLLNWHGGPSPDWQCDVQLGRIRLAFFSAAEGPLRTIRGPYDWRVAQYDCQVVPDTRPPHPPMQMTFISVSLWPVLVAFAWYPALVIVTFLRGPWRRRRRADKGLCVRCKYNLTGLVEPRCPECGTAFDPETFARPSDRQ